MGRKAKFDGKASPSGPGRKAKKQGEPTFPAGLLGMVFKIKNENLY